MTHAFDQNQRFQFLNFTAGAGKVTVQAPANANLAPPGDYLLFLLNGNGVPSVGSFVRLGVDRRHDAADRAEPLVGDGSAGQGHALLDGVDRRQRRSPTTTSTARRRPASRRAPANRIAQPTRHRLHRHRAPGRHLLLQGHRRGRRRQRQRAPRTRRARRSAAAAAGHRRGLRLRRRQRARPRPTSPATATPARSRTRPGRPTGKFGNALSFNGTQRARHRSRLELARPDDAG